MAEFLTIGEPLVVLAAQELDLPLDKVSTFRRFIGGAELNVAIGISRLEHSVSYISKVGKDPFGRFIKESVKNAGIDTSYLGEDNEHLTGFYLKQNVSSGDPNVAYFRKNSAAANLTTKEILSVPLDGVKIAHLSGIFAALSERSFENFRVLNKRLNAANILTVFDPNLRPVLWKSEKEMIHLTNELAKSSRIVLPGISEGETLMGSQNPEDIADFYLKQSGLTQAVVVKLGSAGAFVKTAEGKSFIVPGFKIHQVVDTVGAGDGFAVGLESALLEEWDLESAVRRACAVGALAVCSPGDSDGYPTKEELIKFFNNDERVGHCY